MKLELTITPEELTEAIMLFKEAFQIEEPPKPEPETVYDKAVGKAIKEELRRVIKVGSACANFVETLMENAKKAETAHQADALFLSAVDSVVDGVFWHLTENKEDDMERHKFALETFKTLLEARMKAIDELEVNDGNNTEETDRTLC